MLAHRVVLLAVAKRSGALILPFSEMLFAAISINFPGGAKITCSNPIECGACCSPAPYVYIHPSGPANMIYILHDAPSDRKHQLHESAARVELTVYSRDCDYSCHQTRAERPIAPCS